MTAFEVVTFAVGQIRNSFIQLWDTRGNSFQLSLARGGKRSVYVPPNCTPIPQPRGKRDVRVGIEKIILI